MTTPARGDAAPGAVAVGSNAPRDGAPPDGAAEPPRSPGMGYDYDVDEPFTRAKDLLAFLLEADDFLPTSVFEAVDAGAGGYLFRGHADAAWRLTPTAHRGPETFADYTPWPPDPFHLQHDDPEAYVGSHLAAELYAVHRFLGEADTLGIPTPIDHAAAAAHTRLLKDALNRRGLDVTAEFPDPRLLPSTALAQHHGVPTRLLDWTESPLVAAYFAAERAFNAARRGDRQPQPAMAVLCLDARLIRDLPDVELVAAPRHANAHLRAQRGVFTTVRTANAFYLEHGRWPSLEDIIARDRRPEKHYFRAPFVRLTLPASESGDLLRLLWRHNVTPHHLKPSLASAAGAFAYTRALWRTADRAPPPGENRWV